jgi:hypothetical protein
VEQAMTNEFSIIFALVEREEGTPALQTSVSFKAVSGDASATYVGLFWFHTDKWIAFSRQLDLTGELKAALHDLSNELELTILSKGLKTYLEFKISAGGINNSRLGIDCRRIVDSEELYRLIQNIKSIEAPPAR